MLPSLNLDAVGFVSPRWTRAWTSSDTLLYAVAVGASSVALTTENSAGVRQRAVPSYAALIGSTHDAVRAAVGPAWDPVRLVYAGQTLVFHRELPVEGEAELWSTVVGIADKGSGALVTTETAAVADGEPLFTARRAVFLRGVGGFTAPTPTSTAAVPGAGAVETVVRHRVPGNAALLYRLCGDRHPLHSDPSFARKAGFDRPILHGLCTYGITASLLLHHVLDDDPARMRSLDARFRTPVWPGDTLELRYREATPGRVVFRVDRLGAPRPALDDGELVFDT